MVRSARAPILLVLGLAAGAGALFACQSETPEPPSFPYLKVLVTKPEIHVGEETVDVVVEATDADGKTPGTGTVTIKVAAGELDGEGLVKTQQLANGEAKFKYSCKSDACAGSNRIIAEWDGQTASARVLVIEAVKVVPVVDAGPPDAGGDADGGTDGGLGTGELALTAAKNKLFLSVGDFIELSAELNLSGGSSAAQTLTFTTTLGKLVAADPRTDAGTVTSGTSIAVTTDGSGEAKVWLIETGIAGQGTVSVTHETGAEAEAEFEIIPIEQISWDGTSCGAASCNIMGIKGSGFNEHALVKFKVGDPAGVPIAGVKVKFSIDHPPPGVVVSPEGITDQAGQVIATVTAGKTIGAFAVKAVVIPDLVETLSGTMGIRGAKASNWAFSLRCTPSNVSAYVSALPPAAIDVECSVKVVDRYNNPVGTGTPVNFKVEAGAIGAAITTTAYSPGGANPSEGTGTVIFSTLGAFPPVDTTPLAQAPTQWPEPRQAEPSLTFGASTRNPRDGFVTILAYVRGEEYFQDNNGNGLWDPGEMFVDQGEPFVDTNDNGTWDIGELFIDEAPINGSWDPPNGKWDDNVTIWTETRVLYTGTAVQGAPYSEITPNPISPPCPDGMDTNQSVEVTVRFADRNLNRVAPGSRVDINFARYSFYSSVWQYWDWELLDGFGFRWNRLLADSTTGKECNAASTSCEWKMYFFDWDRGSIQTSTMYGDIGWMTLSTDGGGSAPTWCYNDVFRATMRVESPEVAFNYDRCTLSAPVSFKR